MQVLSTAAGGACGPSLRVALVHGRPRVAERQRGLAAECVRLMCPRIQRIPGHIWVTSDPLIPAPPTLPEVGSLIRILRVT